MFVIVNVWRVKAINTCHDISLLILCFSCSITNACKACCLNMRSPLTCVMTLTVNGSPIGWRRPARPATSRHQKNVSASAGRGTDLACLCRIPYDTDVVSGSAAPPASLAAARISDSVPPAERSTAPPRTSTRLQRRPTERAILLLIAVISARATDDLSRGAFDGWRIRRAPAEGEATEDRQRREL